MDEKGLGARLQLVRREKGFTQQKLCQMADLSYSTLAKMERGAIKSPSIFTIQRIAEVLGIGLDELLGSVEPAHSSRQLRHTKSGVGFIYFDINGCLIRGYQRAFTAIAAQTDSLPDVIETCFWRYNDKLNTGEMSLTDLDSDLSRRVGAPVNWVEAYLHAVEPIVEMQTILTRVAELYKIGLLTNSMPGVVNELKARGIIPSLAYDAVVDSSQLGIAKPDARIYQAATKQAGCDVNEILLIDDDRANLIAAETGGWHTLQFDGGLPDESLTRIKAALELD